MLIIGFGPNFYDALCTFLKNLILSCFSLFGRTCWTHYLRYQWLAVMYYSCIHDVSTIGSTDSWNIEVESYLYLADEWICWFFSCMKRVANLEKKPLTTLKTSSSWRWWHCLQSTSNSSRLICFSATVPWLPVAVLLRITFSLSIIDNSKMHVLVYSLFTIMHFVGGTDVEFLSSKRSPVYQCYIASWKCSSMLLFVGNARLKIALHVHGAYV